MVGKLIKAEGNKIKWVIKKAHNSPASLRFGYFCSQSEIHVVGSVT